MIGLVSRPFALSIEPMSEGQTARTGRFKRRRNERRIAEQVRVPAATGSTVTDLSISSIALRQHS
ncbi:hypothetical protein [Methylobacterium sp. Leaf117]|uniref:hypothetical protein n=1 Tax=Methylobacterium sp. Leaf117 TaxID=1736260 RepID=UPI000A8A637F|nr:hypothetical protein [Methylobacterium sp. Leaf117]